MMLDVNKLNYEPTFPEMIFVPKSDTYDNIHTVSWAEYVYKDIVQFHVLYYHTGDNMHLSKHVPGQPFRHDIVRDDAILKTFYSMIEYNCITCEVYEDKLSGEIEEFYYPSDGSMRIESLGYPTLPIGKSYSPVECEIYRNT